MSGGANTPGISALARLILDAAGGKNAAAIADLGGIGKDMSLLVDGFSVPIPKGEYLVCAGASAVKAGARVLVIWLGGDAVVVDGIA